MFKLFGDHQKPELRHLMHSIFLPVVILLLMFSIHLISELENLDLHFLGIKPLSLKSLLGILFSPFIHSDWNHLFNNSVSFFLLSVSLFYFYREIAYKVFIVIYLLAGAWLWFGGREGWHIGASGVIYGLMSFLFISGLIRRHIPLMAVTLFVVFIYGNMVWGMFPLARFMQHSWEGHLWGFLAGITAAVIFRNEGPQKPPSPFEDEDEDETIDGTIIYESDLLNNDNHP